MKINLVNIPYEVLKEFSFLGRKYTVGDIFYFVPNSKTINYKKFIQSGWIVPITEQNTEYSIKYVVNINNVPVNGVRMKKGEEVSPDIFQDINKAVLNGTIAIIAEKLKASPKKDKAFKLFEVAKQYKIDFKKLVEVLNTNEETKQLIGEKPAPVKSIKSEDLEKVNKVLTENLNK